MPKNQTKTKTAKKSLQFHSGLIDGWMMFNNTNRARKKVDILIKYGWVGV